MMKKLAVIILISIIGCPISSGARNYADSISRSLANLDNILLQRDTYTKDIKEELNRSLAEYKTDQSPQAQYNSLRSLFNIYRTYKIDSALIVADRRLDVARALGEQSKIISATLNLADGYVKSGNTDFAISILDTLDINLLAPHQLKYLNSIYKNAYANRAASSILPQERMNAINSLNRLREKELEETDKDSRGYLSIQAEMLRDAGLYQEAVAKMEEARRKFDMEDNASLLYELGETYLKAGREEEAIMALSKAAGLDISAGSKEYKALILLASVLFDCGQVDRSFAYINYALEDAMFSKANIRTEQIIKILPNIYKAYSEKEKEIKYRTTWFFIAIGILNIILFILLGLLIREHRIKKQVIKDINKLNSNLEVRNERLEKSDNLKMEHLKRFMMAYAAYITRVKSFRKNIYRLLKTSQISKAVEKLKTEKEEAPDNAAFQEMFDAVFLSMFPDFITELNRYLKEPLDQNKDGDRLTPETRIAALMKLGITSTQEISDMFQYSAQSVYNLRSTLRSLLNVSWEEFEEKIKES